MSDKKITKDTVKDDIKEFLSKDMTAEEKAALGVHMTRTFIRASNGVGGAYLSSLKKNIKNLEELKKTKNE